MQSGQEALLDAWRVNDRVTGFLVDHVPPELWAAAVPGSPRRTVRSIAAHLHNCRLMWMKSLAAGIPRPLRVDPYKASPGAVSEALGRSGEGVLRLLEAGLENGGELPGVSSPFVWGALPRNVTLFVAYAVAHEAHHRGQVLLLSRALGHRLPPGVAGGLWQWSSRLRETRPDRR